MQSRGDGTGRAVSDLVHVAGGQSVGEGGAAGLEEELGGAVEVEEELLGGKGWRQSGVWFICVRIAGMMSE